MLHNFILTPEAKKKIKVQLVTAMIEQDVNGETIAKGIGTKRQYINAVVNCTQANIPLQRKICGFLGLKWEEVFGPYYHE